MHSRRSLPLPRDPATAGVNPGPLSSLRGARGRSSGLRGFAVAALVLMGAAQVVHAQIVSAYVEREAFNVRGDVILVGNGLITCLDGDNSCEGVRDGTVEDSNNRLTQYVNIDPDALLLNSSSADLVLPPDATVLAAGLYWGGRADPAEPADSRGVFRFKPPGAAAGASGYLTINAAPDDIHTIAIQGTPASRPYMAFADVTDIVQAAGAGTYTGGGLTASLGQDGLGYYGGWAMFVIIEDPAERKRRIVLFDGAANVSTGNEQTVTITGLITPAAGNFTARAGALVWEGDRTIIGDRFLINNTEISDGVFPATNFWNSGIIRLGELVTNRNPNYVNLMALDLKYVEFPQGIVPNGATSAQLTFRTTGDTYFPHAFFFMADFASADMNVTLSGFPPAAAPGETVTGTATCTSQPNPDNDPAEDATCAVTGLPDGATVTCSPTPPVASLLPGELITCSVSYTAPLSGSTTIVATTGASNDGNAGNNSAQTLVPVINAVDDAPSPLVREPTGTTSYNLLGNDTVGGSPAVVGGNIQAPTISANGGLTGATIDSSGQLVVPNDTPAGSYTVTYQICTSTTPAACDTANKTIVVAAPPLADMRVSLSLSPTAPMAGQRVTGTATCTNEGPVVAQIATCGLSGLPSSATVTCVPTSPQATLAVGATIVCQFSFTASAGSFSIAATAGAFNDTVAGNNTSAQTIVAEPTLVTTLEWRGLALMILLFSVAGVVVLRSRL
jgi:hypothetical protein